MDVQQIKQWLGPDSRPIVLALQGPLWSRSYPDAAGLEHYYYNHMAYLDRHLRCGHVCSKYHARDPMYIRRLGDPNGTYVDRLPRHYF